MHFKKLESLALFVLQPMSFIYNEKLEGNVDEGRPDVLAEDFKGSDYNIKFDDLMLLSGFSILHDLCRVPLVLSHSRPSLLRLLVIVEHSIEEGPFLSDLLPVRKSGERSDDEKRSFVDVLCVKVVEKSHGLDCLSKPHLICKHHVSILMPSFDQPVHSCHLIRLENLSLLELWHPFLLCRVKLIGFRIIEHFVSESL
jgi:hypothetical protein